ncbi:hypothetical protein IAT40_005212 [Kwoniella sp. CBS 6097]
MSSDIASLCRVQPCDMGQESALPTTSARETSHVQLTDVTDVTGERSSFATKDSCAVSPPQSIEQRRKSVLFYRPLSVGLTTDPHFYPDGPYDSYVLVGSSPTARSNITAYKSRFTSRLRDWHHALHYDPARPTITTSEHGARRQPGTAGTGLWGNLRNDISAESHRIVHDLATEERFENCTAVEVDEKMLKTLKRLGETIADDQSEGCLVFIKDKSGVIDTGLDVKDGRGTASLAGSRQRLKRRASSFSKWSLFNKHEGNGSKGIPRAWTFTAISETNRDAKIGEPSLVGDQASATTNELTRATDHPGLFSGFKFKTYVPSHLSAANYASATDQVVTMGENLFDSVVKRSKVDTRPLKEKDLRNLIPKRQVALHSETEHDASSSFLKSPIAKIVPACSVIAVTHDVWDKLDSIEGSSTVLPTPVETSAPREVGDRREEH